jgi:hypothetical protein
MMFNIKCFFILGYGGDRRRNNDNDNTTFDAQDMNGN